MAEIQIRPLQESDRAEWRRLWTAYLDFYRATVPEEVYATTWQRLFAPGEFEPKGLLAIVGGKPAGLVHYLYHRSCWSTVNNCYLQDLSPIRRCAAPAWGAPSSWPCMRRQGGSGSATSTG